MPELPEIEGYVAGLEAHVQGQTLERVRLKSPFLLRSVEPPLAAFEGGELTGVGRLGKRLVLGFAGVGSLVLHLMIAGRLRWKAPGAGLPGKAGLLALDFSSGTLILTEQGSKRRASLHAVAAAEDLAPHDPSGLDVRGASPAAFAGALRAHPRTVKRALCDPRTLDGIGNAWSDEILHRAGMSPFQRVRDMDSAALEALRKACLEVLEPAVERHRTAALGAFPDKVTAFQAEMAVHGRFGQPCPVCGAPVQRIVFATRNEMNYCAGCQTGGRILADRALSRLLREDWPKHLEDLEQGT